MFNPQNMNSKTKVTSIVLFCQQQQVALNLVLASQPHSQGRTTETLVDSTCLQILLYHDSMHFYQYIINGEWEEKNSKSNLTCLIIKILNWQTAQCSYLLLQPGEDEFTRPWSKN